MHGRLVVAAVLAAFVLSGASASAQLAPEVELAEAERLFDAFDFEAAIEVLNPLIDQLAATADGNTDLLARCYGLRGRAAFNLGRVQASESDFVSLLQIDASVRLPDDESPRMVDFFDLIRSSTVGTLFVTMDPPGRLVVDGREFFMDSFNAVLAVAAGTRTILASLPGHRNQEQVVTIEPGQNYSLDIGLERVAGSLTFATDPAGARVSVDGEFVGETQPDIAPGGPSVPLLVLDLAPGQHQLQIERPCSAPQFVPFNIPDPPVDADIGVIRLEPAVAAATIDTTVDGAMVYVDGTRRTRAPVRLDDICAGERVIEVRTRRQRFVDRREWRSGDSVTLSVDLRWAFALLPGVSESATARQLLSRMEAALRDSQRVLLMSPTGSESDVIAANGASISVVTDELRGVAERRAAGERLADALNVQGVAWVRPSGGSSGALSLFLLARGSGVPDRLVVDLTDLGSRAAGARALSVTAPDPTRPSLGVSFVDVGDVEGAAVVRVTTGGDDRTTGFAPGDVVVGIDGAPVTSAADVARVLDRRGVGVDLRVEVRNTMGNRIVTVRVAELPYLVPLSGTTRLTNLLLPDMEAAVAAAATPIAESAARLNLAVAHIRLRNWDRALRELGQVALPAGGGVSAGTVSYLTALCLLETGQLVAAEAALRRAAAAGESVLFVGGPRVSVLARQRLAQLSDLQR